MLKRIIDGIKRRLAEYRVKLNFRDVCYSAREYHNIILSPEFVYRDDNSTYISSFIKHEETGVTPWDIDEKSDISRISYIDSGMHLYSRLKKENWMCFFYRDVKDRCSFSFDIEDHKGLDEIQVSFHCDSLRERYRFMIRNNKTAVFEVIKDGRFYRYVKQRSCAVPLDEKHKISVVVDGNHYSLLVDKKPVLSLRDRKNLIGNVKDNKMIMLFYNRNGEINCDVSAVEMQY